RGRAHPRVHAGSVHGLVDPRAYVCPTRADLRRVVMSDGLGVANGPGSARTVATGEAREPARMVTRHLEGQEVPVRGVDRLDVLEKRDTLGTESVEHTQGLF